MKGQRNSFHIIRWCSATAYLFPLTHQTFPLTHCVIYNDPSIFFCCFRMRDLRRSLFLCPKWASRFPFCSLFALVITPNYATHCNSIFGFVENAHSIGRLLLSALALFDWYEYRHITRSETLIYFSCYAVGDISNNTNIGIPNWKMLMHCISKCIIISLD